MNTFDAANYSAICHDWASRLNCHLAESDEWKAISTFKHSSSTKVAAYQFRMFLFCGLISRAEWQTWDLVACQLTPMTSIHVSISHIQIAIRPSRLCWRLSCRKRFFTAEIMCYDTMSLYYTFPDDCPTKNIRLTIGRWSMITTKVVQFFFEAWPWPWKYFASVSSKFWTR